MTLIIDASVAVKWFFEEPGHLQARAIIDRNEVLSAPILILAEIANAAWKRLRRGEIERVHADTVLALMPRAFTDLVALDRLMAPAGRLVLEHDHPIYDCFYLALAEREGAPLLTADRKLAAIAEQAGLKVELFGHP